MNKFISFLAAASLLALQTPAYATTGNNGNGNGGCGVGQTTNGCGDVTVPLISYPTNVLNTTSTSNATGVGIGVGVSSSESNSNSNSFSNAIANGGSVKSDIRNSNDNTLLNVSTNHNSIGNVSTGASTSHVGNVSSSSNVGNLSTGASNSTVGNVSTGASTSKSDQSQSTQNSNNSQVIVAGDEAQQRNPVSTAYASPLIAGSDTCMGSTSAGGQGIGFALSLGTTWTDKNCMNLKNARQLQSMGYSGAAVQLVCMNKDVRKAMSAAGTPCEKIKE